MEKEIKIIPGHVAITMDGSEEWAAERNLPRIEGYAKGFSKLKIAPAWFFEKGVSVLSVFAFSAEYWNKDQKEVNFLMKLIKKTLKDDLDIFKQAGFRIMLSGRIDELPGDLSEICRLAVNGTKEYKKGILNICLNYSGRAEIVDSIKKILKNKLEPEQIHEGIVRKYLYNSELSDPDLMVRTSGKQKYSDFLLWEAANCELILSDNFWPDFEKIDVEKVLYLYDERLNKSIAKNERGNVLRY